MMEFAIPTTTDTMLPLSSVRLMEMVLEHMEEGIVLYDTNGTAYYANQAAKRMGLYGCSAERELPLFDNGLTPVAFEHTPIAAALKGETCVNRELWLMPKGKPVGILLCSSKPILNDKHENSGAILIVHDITQRRWTEQRLAVSEQRYRSMFDYNPDTVCWLDLAGSLLSANPAAVKLTGRQAVKLTGRQYHDLISASSVRTAVRHFRKALKGVSQLFELELCPDSGNHLMVNVTAVPMIVESQIVGLFLIVQDITERKEAEAMINRLAYRDKLTELPNRYLFHCHLREQITSATQNDTKLAIFFIDLDRFKYVNDTLGHHIGDLLLVGVAKRLNSSLRCREQVYRLGGDEFTVIIPHVTKETAAETAQAIVKIMEAPFFLGGHELVISPSIGVSLFPDHGKCEEDLLKHADMAMYRAKKLGNGFSFYHTDMKSIFSRQLQLDKGLRKALEQNQFVIYYQPQIHVASGATVGVEALIRWKHPELGLIPPLDFIPIAEETGLVIAIGNWLLTEASRQVKSWHLAGFPRIRLAVNLSARQFQDPHLPDRVRQAIAESGLEPSNLELEITEGAAMQQIGKAIGIMRNIKETGVQIALDDFGTGYSSLSYLKLFPIDTIKIDKSFIRQLAEDQQDMAIVSAVITMARGLKLDVIAEGVEHPSQLLKLRKLGCGMVQGYMFAPPMPAEELEPYLDRALQQEASYSQQSSRLRKRS